MITYSLNYDTESDPTRILLDITAVSQTLIDYVVEKGQLKLTTPDEFYLLEINRTGTTSIGAFDFGRLVINIAEDQLAEDWQTLSDESLTNRVQEEFDTIQARVKEVLEDIPNALAN